MSSAVTAQGLAQAHGNAISAPFGLDPFRGLVRTATPRADQSISTGYPGLPVVVERVSRQGIVHRAPAGVVDPVVPPLFGQSRKTRPVMCPVNEGRTVQRRDEGLKIGYARVSTDEHNLSAQLAALGLRRAATELTARWVTAQIHAAEASL